MTPLRRTFTSTSPPALAAAVFLATTAAINGFRPRDFAREWVESLRVKHKAPRGEDGMARMALKPE